MAYVADTKPIAENLADHFAWFGTISNTDSATQPINFSAPSTGVFFSKKRECVFSADYWLLKIDGTIVDNGEAALTWEATGEVIDDAEGLGMFEALIKYMGGENAAKAYLTENNSDLEGVAELTGETLQNALMTQLGVTVNQETGILTGMSGIAMGTLSEELAANHADYQDWMAHSDIHGHFNFAGQKVSGQVWNTAYQYYRFIRPYYMESEAAGAITEAGGLAAWVDDRIDLRTFMGHNVYAHSGILDQMQAAEAALREAGFTETDFSFGGGGGGFVPRLTSSGALSNHALGAAFDINVNGNAMIFEAWSNLTTLINHMNPDIDVYNTTDPVLLETASNNLESLANIDTIDQYIEEFQTVLAAQAYLESIGESNFTSGISELVSNYINENQEFYDIISQENFVDETPYSLFWYVQQGFMNQDPEFINIMEAQGIDPGSSWGPSDHMFDSMHFDFDVTAW
jgi:hypothetical protein